MAFVQPTYNLTAGIWRPGTGPPSAAAVSTPANLSPGRITSGAQPEGYGAPVDNGPMWLRVPAGKDIRDIYSGSPADLVEVPFGSGRFYQAMWVDDIGIGFTNEHRFAVLQKVLPWPVPYPYGVGPYPGAPDAWVNMYNQNAGAIAANAFAGANLTMPVNARVVFVVAGYNQAAAVTFQIDALAFAAATLHFQFPSGGNTCDMYLYHAVVNAGVHTWGAKFAGAATGYFHYCVNYSPWLPTTLVKSRMLAGLATRPQITDMPAANNAKTGWLAVSAGYTWTLVPLYNWPWFKRTADNTFAFPFGTNRLTSASAGGLAGGVLGYDAQVASPIAWGTIETAWQ